MNPLRLDHGTLYAAEIARYRADSDRASFARLTRRYPFLSSITQWTAFAAIALPASSAVLA